MSKFSKWIVAICAAVALALVGFAPSGASAHDDEPHVPKQSEFSLTEEEFYLYCRGLGYQLGVTSVYPHDAWHLRCKDADGSLREINVKDACYQRFGDKAREEYGNWINGKPIDLIDRLEDVGDAYGGWGCFVNFGFAGQIHEENLQDWCAEHEGSNVRPNDGRTFAAYGRFCANGQGIPMDRLCAELFGHHSIDRLVSPYKPYWECWKDSKPKRHQHWH